MMTNKIRSPWLTGSARYTRTTCAALVLWVMSQVRRQAMPGSSPQFAVSVPDPWTGTVAWNTELPPQAKMQGEARYSTGSPV